MTRSAMLKAWSKHIVVAAYLMFFTPNAAGNLMCKDMVSPNKIKVQALETGQIVFPGGRGEKYESNQVCEWHIEGDPGNIIELHVERCSIQDRDIRGQCNQDYVNLFDVRNGDTHFMDRFCGTGDGMVYRSSGPSMIVRFHSDIKAEYLGFELSFQAQSKSNSGEGSDHDITVQLAVGIPVGILVTVMVIAFSVAVYRFHRKNQTLRGRYTSSGELRHQSSSQQHLTQHSSTAAVTSSPPPSFADGHERHLADGVGSQSVVGRGPPAWATQGQGYPVVRVEDGEDPYIPRSGGYGDVPMQVYIPQDGYYGGEESFVGGRSSPPPAYDSLGYDVHQPMTPPPYDAVVKDWDGRGNGSRDSGC